MEASAAAASSKSSAAPESFAPLAADADGLLYAVESIEGCGISVLTIHHRSLNGKEETVVGRVRAGNRRTQYGNGLLYYVTEGGTLASLDLRSGSDTSVTVPGVSPQMRGDYCMMMNPEKTVHDILLDGNTLFALRGSCGFIDDLVLDSCVLFEIDLATNEAHEIADVVDLVFSERVGLAFAPPSDRTWTHPPAKLLRRCGECRGHTLRIRSEKQ
jgi:hypothetical protein